MAYRPIPTDDAIMEDEQGVVLDVPHQDWFGRLLCWLGIHSHRVIDAVNMCTFCTACNRHVNPKSWEIWEAYDQRIRFEKEYLFLRSKYHGKKSGDGLLLSQAQLWIDTKTGDPCDQRGPQLALVKLHDLGVSVNSVIERIGG